MAEEITSTTQSAQNSAESTQTSTATNDTDVTTNETQTEQNDSQVNPTRTDIEKMIQSAVDRATNKLGNENKRLRNQLESLKNEKLSDDELKEFKLREREADVADREAKLKEKESQLFAIKAIKDAGLDDGSSNALDLVDFVMTDDEETTLARVKSFESLVKKFVAAEVNRTFKENGRNPEKSGSNNTPTQNSVAADIGKRTADRNKSASDVLNYYLGGK